jgi:putative transposase
MVADPAAYPWSSYGANTGTRVDSLIRPHAELLALASEVSERHASYARLIAEKLDPELIRQIEEAADSGYPLASEAFKADLAARLGRKMEPGRPGRPEKKRRDTSPGLSEIGL